MVFLVRGCVGKSFHPLSVFRGPDPLKQILVSWENAYFGKKSVRLPEDSLRKKKKQTKKLFVKKSPASSVLSPDSCAAFLYQGCL